ncbi:LysR family transcriptional regulator [Sediminicurvatus halobius]|uniref:LysR family transcriptional regulator n=1 Tax=Sediminicurvatus halobius TaxID=2182432 RepID=A0A2U2MX09_9GAMM|nr:LysR family transcriptional regulator [Spiribacter halobius]PWG61364.1 LysR family transcriptional regulator [Spiribacter halobius]UEX76579.1 LysR family transcriptional regulator [Spiribacter halobius]
MLEWDDLRYVRALGSAGTLAGAAEHLRVHASTVFRRLGQVESRLGVRLFDRHHDGFSLTPAGEETLALAERMGTEVEALERRLAGRDTRPSGIVRVTTTDTLLLGVLGPVLGGFRAENPAIRLELVSGNPFLSLSRRDADVALRPTADPPETLVGRRIAEVATAVYASHGYLENRGAAAPLQEQCWIAPDDSLAHLGSARWLRRELPGVEPVIQCNSVAGMHALTRGGVGLAPLPCFLGDPDPALVRVTPPLSQLTVGLWLLTHPDLRRVARIRALLDFLHARLRDQSAMLAGDVPSRPAD